MRFIALVTAIFVAIFAVAIPLQDHFHKPPLMDTVKRFPITIPTLLIILGMIAGVAIWRIHEIQYKRYQSSH